jgi:hypothetical protein
VNTTTTRVTSAPGAVYDVIFIPLDDYLPPYDGSHGYDDDEVAGSRWRAELHPDLSHAASWQFKSQALATAWVYVYQFRDSEGAAEVRWIEVPESQRRRGFATLLLAGMEARWPNVILTSDCTEEGWRFIQAASRRSRKERPSRPRKGKS